MERLDFVAQKNIIEWAVALDESGLFVLSLEKERCISRVERSPLLLVVYRE